MASQGSKYVSISCSYYAAQAGHVMSAKIGKIMKSEK
jgi:hypothetical protein